MLLDHVPEQPQHYDPDHEKEDSLGLKITISWRADEAQKRPTP